jgi:hypothetical protein
MENIFDQIVKEPTVKIPAAVMGNLLLIAARGFKSEDSHNEVTMNSEDFTSLSRILARGILFYPGSPFKTWLLDELEHFWKEFDPPASEPAPVPDNPTN